MSSSAVASEAQDAGGVTRSDVAKMSPEQEFVLAGQRLSVVEDLLEESQKAIYSGEWSWIGSGIAPESAIYGIVDDSLEGADGHNSYYLELSRFHKPKGASGDRADLAKARRFFEARGWEVREQKLSDDFFLKALTPDGYRVEYMVHANGQYTLAVFTQLFWTNDSNALVHSIVARAPRDFPQSSLPGVREKFPSWSDPVATPSL